MGVIAFSFAIAAAFATPSGAVDASQCYSPRADAPVNTTLHERIASFVERTTATTTALGSELGLDDLLDDALGYANSVAESGARTDYDNTGALETFMTDMRSADRKRAQSVSAAESTLSAAQSRSAAPPPSEGGHRDQCPSGMGRTGCYGPGEPCKPHGTYEVVC